MAKTSFSKRASAAAPAEPAPAVAPQASPAAQTAPEAPQVTEPVAGAEPAVTVPAVAAPLPPPAPSAPSLFDDENIEVSDLVIPRINIAQKVGDLGEVHKPGSVVFDKTLVLSEAPLPNTVSEPVRFCVVGFQPKKFVEKVPFGTQGGRTVDTEQEVDECGGTLDYNEAKQTGKPLFERLATALLVLEKPAKCDDAMFNLTLDGKKCAFALWSMKSSSYTNGAKIILTARKMGHLQRGGYRSGWWTLASVSKKFQNGNVAFIPVVKPAGSTSEAFQTELRQVLGF